MKTPTLAPVYLDNEPVSLMGDPRPPVSKVIAATGKHPEKFDIKLLHSETDTEGKILGLDDVIDRTEEPTKAIYLTSVEKEAGLESEGAEGAESGIQGKSGSGSFGKPSGGSSGGAFGKGGGSQGSMESSSSSGPGGQWGKTGTAQGGSTQGNQGYGSGSGKVQNQGTSTQNQGQFGQGSGLQQSGKTGGQELKGGVGTSSQTSQGKTQNLGSSPSSRTDGKGKTVQGAEDQGEDWPVQGGQGSRPGTPSKGSSTEDAE